MNTKRATNGAIFYNEETAHQFSPDNDLRGRKFGRLTVVQFAYKRNKNYAYKCICDCGKECVKTRDYLLYITSSVHKSCGCWRKEEQAKTTQRTHSMHTREYRPEYIAWKAMRQRCYNPNERQFEDYGGRGVKICDRWQCFNYFLADMGKKPSPKHSIDRIDVNGDYCPENCRWATVDEQANNKRNSVLVTYNGKTQTFKQWCNELNLPYYCAISMYKRGKRTFAEIIDFYKGK